VRRIGALALLAAAALSGHGQHASLTAVDYLSKSKSLEVTIVMSADHLETILRRESGREIEIDRTPGAEALASAYIRERFVFRLPSGEEIVLRWVGMEAKADQLRAYLEAAKCPDPEGMSIRNDLLFDFLPDQINLFTLRRDRKGKSFDHTFSRGAEPARVAFPK
jgi:hypothetical protein